MKNLLITLVLAFGLIGFGWYVFEKTVEAQTNVAVNLFGLPAPPPPNPFFRARGLGSNSMDYEFDKGNPPPDDAAIEDVLKYWEMISQTSSNYRTLNYIPEMSDRALQQIHDEIDKNPERLGDFINALPDTPETAEFAKTIYQRQFPNGAESEEDYRAGMIKDWLTRHSPEYADQLIPAAQAVGDTPVGYVNNQEELLALARVNWEKARPFVERLYNDSSQPVSQTLARWVYYQHALREGSGIDADRYRRELMDKVEDKSAKPGERDLAMDALVTSGDFEGRDEWYLSLLEDETLHDLRVGGQSYTGLTTLITVSKPGKYTDKMLAMLDSASPAARTAIVRNLGIMLNTKNPEIVKALLPWLENPKWAKETTGERRRLVEALANFQIPESVPGLIQMLNEKIQVSTTDSSDYAGNRMMDNKMMSNTRVPGNVMTVERMSGEPSDNYPFRRSAINALIKQRDYRAAGALRQILPEVEEYERGTVVQAILYSGGFSIPEEITALEATARNIKDDVKADQDAMATQAQAQIAAANTAQAEVNQLHSGLGYYDPPPEPPTVSGGTSGVSMNMSNTGTYEQPVKRPMTAQEMSLLLGAQLTTYTDPPDELVTAVAERITRLETSEPLVAAALRRILQNWNGRAVNTLMLRDLKNGKAETGAVVKLLSLRKELRENQSGDVSDARGAGNPVAAGIAACILEDGGDYAGILSGENTDAKIALLGCGRLIRAKLPLEAVAQNFSSANKFLQRAAELYLESEDSPQARALVLARHQGEAKVLGATTAFQPAAGSGYFDVTALYASIDRSLIYLPYYAIESGFEKTETRLQKEVKTDENLLGVYSYDGSYVRFYKDRVMFSYDEDAARYRERPLADYEFNRLKDYLVSQRVDELPPFLSYCDECIEKELVMLGRQGGRRVYLRASQMPEFFAGLEEIFKEMRKPEAKLRYYLENDVAGLEILFASESLQAQTVWKEGGETRLLIADPQRRKQVDEETNRLDEADKPTENDENFDYEKMMVRQYQRRVERQYDHLAWYQFGAQGLGATAAQPPIFDSIPRRDGQAAPASNEQWKARAGNVEIRAGFDGLYKISGGRAAKIGEGIHLSPVVTPDGRWAIVSKFEEGDRSLLRVNLATNRSAPVKIEEEGIPQAVAFVPSIGKILIYNAGYNDYDYDEYSERPPTAKHKYGTYLWLDAATGAVSPVKGEVRPLAQQTFRPLQSNGKPDEFWAAIPDEDRNTTQVGIYNAKTFAFKPVLKVPRILFDSMNMWVDAAANKALFVYNGQLLALPLPVKTGS